MKQEIPVKLLAAKATLQNPDNHEVPYYAETWNKKLANDSDFSELIQKYPQQICRSDIANLAIDTLTGNGNSRKVFLATMLWGYGTVGYGAYRTSVMLGDKKAQTIIEKAFELVAAGKYVDAYEMFVLPMCGPAFFTKYFYFVGWGSKTIPMPLILDSVVSNSLEKLGVDISQLAKVTRNSAGNVASVNKYLKGYIRYVEMINNWANEIGCRPDSIEKWLFVSQN